MGGARGNIQLCFEEKWEYLLTATTWLHRRKRIHGRHSSLFLKRGYGARINAENASGIVTGQSLALVAYLRVSLEHAPV